MNSITPMNNVNFGAKILPMSKYAEGCLSKERWNNVAGIFEQKTAKYPNDVLYYLDNGEAMYFEIFKDNYVFKPEIAQKLASLKDSQIAQKFEQLFNIVKEGENALDYVKKFTEKVNNKMDTTFWESVNNAVKSKKKQDFLNDEFFREAFFK